MISDSERSNNATLSYLNRRANTTSQSFDKIHMDQCSLHFRLREMV
jgi:hypothetical protein